MLIAFVLAVVTCGVSLAYAGGNGNETTTAQVEKAPAKMKKQSCPDVGEGIAFYKQATWKWQTLLGVPKTKASKRQIASNACAYARSVAELWQKRSHKVRVKYEEHQKFMRKLADPATAICYVFGNYCQQALGVARCESNLRTWASNGQYQGIFQMGSSERSIYGHSSTALGQAQAAYRYFIASGSDWSPWQCTPSGGLQW